MIAVDSPATDAEECETCSKVRPATSVRQCTRARALALLEKGFCLCSPPVPGGLAALAPETQEIYRDLIDLSEETAVPETMVEPVTFDDSEEAPPTTLDLVPVDEAEDVWEAPSPGTELALPSQRQTRRQQHAKRSRRKRRKTTVLKFKPASEPGDPEPVWTHPREASAADPQPVRMIDGGSIITSPHPLPTIQEE